MESVTVILLVTCAFLSIYFAFLSFQVTEEALKEQLVLLAAYSLITSIVIFACLIVFFGLKSFLRVKGLT